MRATRRRRSLTPLAAALLLGAALSAGIGAAESIDHQSQLQYERDDAEKICAQAHEILQQQRFKPRGGLWKSFREWLRKQFASWKLPDFGVGGRITRTIFWILVAVFVLAILAVLTHFVWVLVTMWRRRGSQSIRGSADPSVEHFQVDTAVSYDQLRQRMAELARQGAFREAIGVMLRALLRYLDDAKTLTCHHSKTNSEYVREYPRRLPGSDSFRRFIASFDTIIYGKDYSESRDFDRMIGMFEEVQSHVRP